MGRNKNVISQIGWSNYKLHFINFKKFTCTIQFQIQLGFRQLGLKMHVSFQLVGQFKIIFPHFTGLQQGWVGGPWTEYFQNCDTDFISFIKRVSWGFRFQDTCVVKVEKLWLLCLAVEGENCLDLVILSLYQFLQLGSGSRSNCPPPLSGEDDAANVHRKNLRRFSPNNAGLK